jgi:hypothetical protein
MKLSGSVCIQKSVYFALQALLKNDSPDLFIANSVLSFYQMLKDKKYTKQCTVTSKQFKIGDTQYKLRIGATVVSQIQRCNNQYLSATTSVGEPTLSYIKLSIMGLNGHEWVDLRNFFAAQEDVIFEETCLMPHQTSD